jgi:hypothetical protein
MERPQVANPAADTRAILWGKSDSGMLGTFRREPQKILIVGAQDPAHGGGPLQVIRVAATQLSQISGGYGINP